MPFRDNTIRGKGNERAASQPETTTYMGSVGFPNPELSVTEWICQSAFNPYPLRWVSYKSPPLLIICFFFVPRPIHWELKLHLINRTSGKEEDTELPEKLQQKLQLQPTFQELHELTRSGQEKERKTAANMATEYLKKKDWFPAPSGRVTPLLPSY